MVSEVETPKPRIVVWRQVLIGLLLFGYYVIADSLHSPQRRALADKHGRALERLEQWLHLDIEHALNNWLVGHRTLSILANYEYAFTYIASALAALAFIMWRHPEVYRRARMSFVLSTGIGITCFWAFSTTPPRMLPGNTYVDTVTQGHTWGSWGSPMVSGANQLAAMPSLHMAWALWVTVAIASAGIPRWVQGISAVHVAVTLFVILATANHFLLDAVAAAVIVVAADLVARWIHPPWERSIVPSADAFFLHVEERGDPQIVGGLVFFEYAGAHPTRDEIEQLVKDELGDLPRFTQRIDQPGRWRRPRWVEAPPLDWAWHVIDRTVPDRAGAHAAVAELTSERMPRDRPLWRIAMLTMADSGERIFLILMHHAIADGIGTVLHALRLIRPKVVLPTPPKAPGSLQTAAATALGFAHLATDGGRPAPLGESSTRRAFATLGLPMTDVKRAADGHRVTDLVLALTTGAVADAHPELIAPSKGRLKVAVPLMVRDPSSTQEGNATAAVMLDIPLRAASTQDLLAEIETHTAPLRRPTRALASRWVMAHMLRLLPEPAVGWFARTVYGGSFFHGIVSNMPGPTERLSIGGVTMTETYPVLPLAPGAPFVLGGLSWTGVLSFGLATDPALVDADAVLAAMRHRFDALIGPATSSVPAAVAIAPEDRPATLRTAPGDAPADS